MIRKLLALIMSAFIIIANLCSTYQVSANPIVWPILLLGGEALGLGAMSGVTAMASTQGVTFDSPESSRSFVADFLYNMPSNMLQGYKQNFESRLYLAQGAIRVSPELWQYTLDYVDSLQIGNKIRKALDISIGSDGTITPHPVAGSISNPYMLDGRPATYEEIGAHSCKVLLPYGKNDSGQFVEYSPYRQAGVSYVFKYIESRLIGTVSSLKRYDVTFALAGSDSTINYFVTTIYVSGQIGEVITGGISNDDYYDYTKSGVALPVPQLENGERVISVPQSIPYTGSVGITGEMCIPDALTVTDAITDAELDLSETDVDTIEKKINWKPLKRMGNIFTTRFPFSLPWDLLKTFKALFFDNPKPPVWNIAWHDELLNKDFSFVIDLKRYDTMFKIARGFLLMEMIVGLIMGTRKLLGGAT